jgi:hypothetical protein
MSEALPKTRQSSRVCFIRYTHPTFNQITESKAEKIHVDDNWSKASRTKESLSAGYAAVPVYANNPSRSRQAQPGTFPSFSKETGKKKHSKVCTVAFLHGERKARGGAAKKKETQMNM